MASPFPRIVGLTLLVAGVAGCATSGAPAWHNADARRDTQAAFRTDDLQCREQNQYRNANPRWGEDPLFPYLVVDEARAAECLKARGWVPGTN